MRTFAFLAAVALLVAACGDAGEAPATTFDDGGLAATTTAPPATTTPPTTAPAPTTTITPEEGTVDDGTDTTLPEGLETVPIKPEPVPPVDVEIGEVQPGVVGFAELARTDLAERLGADTATIEIVTAEAVVWPDSALGCPQPDMAYLQVLSDGYRILLDHDGQLYSYHGGGSRLDPFLCERPAKPVAGATPGSGAGDS